MRSGRHAEDRASRLNAALGLGAERAVARIGAVDSLAERLEDRIEDGAKNRLDDDLVSQPPERLLEIIPKVVEGVEALLAELVEEVGWDRRQIVRELLERINVHPLQILARLLQPLGRALHLDGARRQGAGRLFAGALRDELVRLQSLLELTIGAEAGLKALKGFALGVERGFKPHLDALLVDRLNTLGEVEHLLSERAARLGRKRQSAFVDAQTRLAVRHGLVQERQIVPRDSEVGRSLGDDAAILDADLRFGEITLV